MTAIEAITNLTAIPVEQPPTKFTTLEDPAAAIQSHAQLLTSTGPEYYLTSLEESVLLFHQYAKAMTRRLATPHPTK